MAQLENSICQHWGHRPPLLLSFVSYLWFLVLVPARLQLRLGCHRNTGVRSGTGLLHSHQPFAVLPSALGVGGLTFFLGRVVLDIFEKMHYHVLLRF